MAAIDLIVEWAQKELPDWQADAVRRLLTQDQLSESDKAELLAMLKSHQGLVDPQKAHPEPRRPRRGDMSGLLSMPPKITLKAMKDIRNVNALPDRSTLLFGHEGLTVIYGQNAAGKSGYARVLKRACRARDTKETILPNVFHSGDSGLASASFKIAIDDEDQPDLPWKYGDESPEILANICVFDSKCARLIVNEKNEVSYLPYGCHVFRDLARLVTEIRNRLEQEKPKPKVIAPTGIHPNTKAWQFISGLNYDTPEKAVDDATAWTQENERELIKIAKDIADAESRDQSKRVISLRKMADRTVTLAEQIEKIQQTLSPSRAKDLEEQINALNTAQEAVSISSKETLSDEPLPGAGLPVWQQLYQAAKEYSVRLAYPNKGFPNTQEDARCVLCMQPLSHDAKQRFGRFKSFMEQTAKKKLEACEHALQTSLKEIEITQTSPLEGYQDVLNELEVRDGDLAERLREYCASMTWRAQNMLEAGHKREIAHIRPATAEKDAEHEPQRLEQVVKAEESAGTDRERPEIKAPKPLTVELATIAKQMEDEAHKLEEAAKPEELVRMKQEKEEMQARKSLANRKQELLEYVSELKKQRKYQVCINETDTTGISKKGRSIVSSATTPRLKSLLEDELGSLGADWLSLDLEGSGRRGETFHKIVFRERQLPNGSNLTDVLSEGEQTVVAIAGFLAELQLGHNVSPIVFDDPVCSLDHRFRQKVARRLAQEAKSRQVIVFTHDIAFLSELRRQAGELGNVYLDEKTVIRKGNEAGVLLDSKKAWHSLSALDRVKYLRNDLNTFRRLWQEDRPKYNRKASFLYDLLRKAWESAVEDVLFHGVVKRHQEEVNTKELRYVTVTDDDWRLIDTSMSKCSQWVHSRSRALDDNRPSPEEIEEDINKLSSFIKEINERGGQLERKRKALLRPNVPAVG